MVWDDLLIQENMCISQRSQVELDSSKLDSAMLVCLYHELVLGLGAKVWLSFVYSEDNWADEPSRGSFGALLAAGGRRRVLVIPSKARLWGIMADFGVDMV